LGTHGADPVELINVVKAGLVILPVMFLLAYLGKLGDGTVNALNHGLFSVLALLMAIVVGAVLTPCCCLGYQVEPFPSKVLPWGCSPIS